MGEHVSNHARRLEQLAKDRSYVRGQIEFDAWYRAFWSEAQRWRKAYNAAEASRLPHPDAFLQAYGEGANI
jgi:hypothetical protein